MKNAAKQPQRRMRLKTEDRRAQILSEATALFAEQGFDANTRTLAIRLGVTQPLLYRYFVTKDLLIEAVLESLFDNNSRSKSIKILIDRTKPIRDRLINFAKSYASQTYDRNWIRLYMHAGLAGGGFNRRYIATITEPLLRTIATEIRVAAGMASGRAIGVTAEELEFLWLFHGGLYYQAIRRHIYGLHVEDRATDALAEASVDALLSGISKIVGIEPVRM